MFCRERAAQVRQAEAEIAEGGGQLVFIGTGSAAMAQAFAEDHAGPHPVLADPDRVTFAAAGMKRGAWSVLHPRMLPAVWRAFRSGFRQGRTQGDPWQQGGVVVLAGGKVLHRAVDAVSGDLVDLDALRAALPRARRGGADS